MGVKIGELPPVSPPDAVYVRQRWIPLATVEYVKECDRIMVEYGAVQGTVRHKRRSARWHAQRLIRLMVDLRLHQRWELIEHVEPRGDGWLWFVEYAGDGRERR